MLELTELQRLAEGAPAKTISVAFTPDELDAMFRDLSAFHGEEDFEAECPVCTAVLKLRTALEGLK